MIKILCLHIISLFLFIHSYGQEVASPLFRTDNGKVTFVSDAPLEFITASSNQLKGILDTKNQTFAFQVDINSLKGFNSPLQQEHFYENYMETDNFQTASFTGKVIEKIDYQTNKSYMVRAKGILKIHGIKQERIIKGIIHVKNNALEISSEFIVPLSDHNISVPKLVYQKIAQEIKVEIKAELVKVEIIQQ